MANWLEILKEIREYETQSPLDSVRRSYIKKLSDYSGRNVICYYSGFLTNSSHPAISINDSDINGFMTTIHKMDKQKGLDLLIHTPGGELAATEAIGDYLSGVFNHNIRVIIPQMAMSGGTMLCCISKQIIMGKHSSIGPIDPQFSGIPAYGVIEEFETAKKEVSEDSGSIPIWQLIIGKYHPTFIGQCYKSIELSFELVKKWLLSGEMFFQKSNEEKESTIKNVVEFLNNTAYTKLHSRHINAEKAKEIGLNVEYLEDNSDFQDAVLSVHHCYMHTFSNSSAVKIIENNLGVGTIFNAGAHQ